MNILNLVVDGRDVMHALCLEMTLISRTSSLVDMPNLKAPNVSGF